MKEGFIVTIVLFFVLNCNHAVAQVVADSAFIPSDSTVNFASHTQNQEEKERELGLEINGLVMDETISKLGRDFYDLFFTQWDINTETDYLIRVIEKPAPGTRTMINVEINDNIVFQQFLQPKYDYIESLAEYAVNTSKEYVHNYNQLQKQLNNEDLQGGGIY